jgi:spore photoproduct lyase
MFPLIYIEKKIQNHPKVQALLERFPHSSSVICDRYQEVFNRKGQNFRLQKQNPSLILAHKHKNWLLPIPASYGIGGKNNFYFSHMLNCPYDCRYCFLQGMYSSAHFVFFVNYNECMQAIEEKLAEHPGEDVYFFSGYDCDSLAMESITDFVSDFLPFFAKHPKAILELRTKSFHTKTLLSHPPIANCIIAFSLTPETIGKTLEHKTPPLHKRLEAMQKLQKAGWTIGFRLDPMIYYENYKEDYKDLIDTIFSYVDPDKIHSISLGPFRLPKNTFKNILSLYPEEKLFAYSLEEAKELVSYPKQLENEMSSYCISLLLKHVSQEKIFACKEELSKQL